MAGKTIKFYNSFWLKKTNRKNRTNPADLPLWPGLPWDPVGYPSFPGNVEDDPPVQYNWYLEESRIKGGYNETSVSLGVRAYVNEESPLQELRSSSIIYSGVLNTLTGFNATNVFSIGEPIIKDLDPADGGIQKLFAEDTNLNIFQTSKTSYILIDKNTIYSGRQGAVEASGKAPVLGQVVPYLGRFGIATNPESFSFFGFRKYFIDKNKGSILRLSRDGITEISNYGLRDYFRDQLSNLNDNINQHTIEWTLTPGQLPFTNDVTNSFNITVENEDLGDFIYKGSIISVLINGVEVSTNLIVTNVETVTGAKTSFKITINQEITIEEDDEVSGIIKYFSRSKVKTAWDNYSKLLTVSLQQAPEWAVPNTNYQTLTFDESAKGWVSYFLYKPGLMTTLNGKFFSTKKAKVWEHHVGDYLNWYGNQERASIQFVVNTRPNDNKNFLTIDYEGSNGWEVFGAVGDPDKYTFTENVVSDGIYFDAARRVRSYDEGLYISQGQPKRVGFDKRSNSYYAYFVNNSIIRPTQVLPTESTSGIKGHYLTVTMYTDLTTDVGGSKKLWTVGTRYV